MAGQATRPWAPALVLRAGALVVDESQQRAWLAGRPVAVSRRQFLLLAALAAHAGRPVPRRWLQAAVWGPDSASRAVAYPLYGLRRALAAAAREAGVPPPRIEAPRDGTYRLVS